MSDMITVEELVSFGFKKDDQLWVLEDGVRFIKCLYNLTYSDWDVFVMVDGYAFSLSTRWVTKQVIADLLTRYGFPTDAKLDSSDRTPAKAVRFRIAVAIDDEGRGCAYGWYGTDYRDDKDKMDVAEEMTGYLDFNVAATHWVEVDIPVPVAPEPTTIEGTVVK